MTTATVPTYQEFMRPLLELLARESGPMQARDAYAKLADAMNLDEASRAVLLPSGKQRAYKNRIGWASSYLRFASLVFAPSRGAWAITAEGLALLSKHAGPVSLRTLETIPAYRAHLASRGDAGSEPGGPGQGGEPRDAGETSAAELRTNGAPFSTNTAEAASLTPDEQLEAVYRSLVAAVAEDLKRLLLNLAPDRFEILVLELLGKMGYGASSESRGHVGRSGDGGIDGVVRLDKLGFAKVHIQAKRYAIDKKIGRPDVQAFFGALAGQRASNGLFITTSSFTKEATDYAESVSGSLILVDGHRLVQLMIDHGLGVQTARTLTIPRIDNDYFDV